MSCPVESHDSGPCARPVTVWRRSRGGPRSGPGGAVARRLGQVPAERSLDASVRSRRSGRSTPTCHVLSGPCTRLCHRSAPLAGRASVRSRRSGCSTPRSGPGGAVARRPGQVLAERSLDAHVSCLVWAMHPLVSFTVSVCLAVDRRPAEPLSGAVDGLVVTALAARVELVL